MAKIEFLNTKENEFILIKIMIQMMINYHAEYNDCLVNTMMNFNMNRAKAEEILRKIGEILDKSIRPVLVEQMDEVEKIINANKDKTPKEIQFILNKPENKIKVAPIGIDLATILEDVADVLHNSDK
mgnify:FL=1